MKRIPKDALFGIFYVKKPNGTRWDSYYRTLEALSPLFRHEEYIKLVDGFYLNICGNFDSVRISYFVHEANSEKALLVFKTFFEKNGISEIKDSEPPRKIILAEAYGGEEYEERFRNFLSLETQIGLELISGNLLQARILFATYRWQVRKASLPFREHFEPTFQRYSTVYNFLSDREKDQFFDDLQMWPNHLQVDWAHMMVNFVLGCDWNRALFLPNYLTPGKPLSISEINLILQKSNLEFQIPPDWKP